MPEFLPFVRRWFAETFSEPTRPQREGWEAIASGRDTLIVAPTAAHLDHHARVALHPAHERAVQAGPREDTVRDRRRGPRAHGGKARRAPRPLARATRGPRRGAGTGGAAPAYRLLGHGEPPRRDARLPHRRHGTGPGRGGHRLRARARPPRGGAGGRLPDGDERHDLGRDAPARRRARPDPPDDPRLRSEPAGGGADRA